MRGILLLVVCLLLGCATEAKLRESIKAVASDINSGVGRVLGVEEKVPEENVAPENAEALPGERIE